MKRKSASKAAAVLARGRRDLVSRVLLKDGGRGLPGLYAELVDGYFRDRLDELRPEGTGDLDRCGYCLAAVGGYGRRELCLESDVDILILSRRKMPVEALDLAQSLFFPLWDMGLDLGHGFRGIRQCLALARKDPKVLASLLDSRLVAGNPGIFQEFESRFRDRILSKKSGDFARWLGRDMDARMARFGDASALLEPHLKEGVGGLRDYHGLLWLGRVLAGAGDPMALLKAGLLGEAESAALADEARFILKVRNFLHYYSGRKNDRLHLRHQEDVARAMGYEDRPGSLAVEGFLARLHRSMAALKSLLASFRFGPALSGGRPETPEPLAPGVGRAGRQLCFMLGRGYPDDPDVLMDIFVHSARTGLSLSWIARGMVSGHLFMVRERLRRSPRAIRGFLEIAASGRAAWVLEQMLETGFLGVWLPEFGRAQDIVQFDTYHVRPVGGHSVEAVRVLESESGESWTGGMPDDARKRTVLVLAALMHDTGKGLGGGHSEKGAAMAAEACRRLGLDEDMARDVEFLVREHLLLAGTATSRDIGDESVVADCAARIGSPSRLKLLALITRADATATGPGVWSPWLSGLVSELCRKLEGVFADADLGGANAARRAMRVRDALRSRRPEGVAASRFETWLENMPTRCFAAHEARDLVRHLDLVRRLEKALEDGRRMVPGGRGGREAVVYDCARTHGAGGWEAAFAARDVPVLFKTVTGVMALLGLSIGSAERFLWRDGTVVETYAVTTPSDLREPTRQMERLGLMVKSALAGRLDLDWRLSRMRASPLDKKPLPYPVRVGTDNAVSEFFTVIEVSTGDRTGLLHDLSGAMLDMGLEVHMAKVATYGDRVLDVFYVRGREGRKIMDASRLKTIRAVIAARVEQRVGIIPD